jgi:hypothetical protein
MIKELARLKENEVELMLKAPFCCVFSLPAQTAPLIVKRLRVINVTVKKKIKPYRIVTLKSFRILRTSRFFYKAILMSLLSGVHSHPGTVN